VQERERMNLPQFDLVKTTQESYPRGRSRTRGQPPRASVSLL